MGLRFGDYGYNPRFFEPQRIGGQDFLVQNDDFSLRFFPPQIARQPGALRMRAVKPPGCIRIFVLGESAAMGDPEPAFGPARHLEVLLRQRYPDTEFEVVNVAFTAINSHVILPIARECANHHGDIWIVYMGNNEMVGPFGAVTVFGPQAPPGALVRLSLALQRTRLGQLGVALARRFQKPATPDASWGGMQMFQQNRVSPDSPKRQRVHRNFEANLEGILRAGTGSGASVLLNTVAVNLRDSPPFASELDPGLGEADRTQFESLLSAGRLSEQASAWEQALEPLRAACALAPSHAEAHYRLARCLDRLGRLDEARAHYQRACDTDALPFRTDSRLNDLIRRVAEGQTNDRVQLVDAATLLPQQSGVGVSGHESFYEHVHFNFDGAYQLGRIWAEAVAEVLPATVRARGQSDWPTQESCERALGLTDWNRKLVTEAVIRRLQQPPLSTQPNNTERIAGLQEYEQRLLARMTRKRLPEAQATYAEAIAAAPNDHFLYEVQGGFLQVTGDLPGALAAWRRVSELMPQDFLPWFQMGILSSRQGNHTNAQNFLRQALQIRPALVEGWSELGQSYAASRKWAEALPCLEEASRLRPQDPTLWAYRASVLGEMGRNLEAIDGYRRALALNPASAEAHGALGNLLAQRGQWHEAVTEYQAALQLKPNDVTVHFNLGMVLLQLGRTADGQQLLQRVLELDPQHAPARAALDRIAAGATARP
jgi:tetratricopeptide (TPR) repeat protein